MSQARKDENKVQNSFNILISRFPIAAVWASISIAMIQVLRSNESESWDRLIYVSATLVAIYTIASSRKYLANTFVLLVGLICLSVGVLGIEKHGTETTSGVDVSNLLWLGFGWVVFLALCVTSLIFLKRYSSEHWPWWLRLLGVTALAYTTILALIAAWQTTSSIIDNYHSEYVINEALAVSAGHLPYVDFIPQYGLLYSFLLNPLKSVMSPDELVNTLYLMCYVSILISFILAAWMVRSNLSRKSWSVALLWVVPFTSLAHLPGREGYSGTIFSLISQIPVRIFPGMLIAVMTVSILAKIRESFEIGTLVKTIALGILSGLGFWINQDFVLLSGLLAVFMLVTFSRSIKISGIAIASYLLGVSLYPIMILLTGNQVNFKYIGFFAVQYGGSTGFMAEEIITPGPVLIILPLISAFFATCVVVFFKIGPRIKQIESEDYRRYLSVTFFATWCLGGFLYYLNRSYASGQMQILFLPLSVAIASFAHLSIWNDLLRRFSSKKDTSFLKQRSASTSILVAAMLFSLPFSTVIASSDPRVELKRISTSPEGHTWPKPNSVEAISIWSELKNDPTIDMSEVAFFGASGNYVELVTGVKSVNVLNSPFDIPITPVTIQTGCDAIFDVNPKYLIVGIEGRSLFRFENNTLCNKYQFIQYRELPIGTVAQRIG